MNKPALLDCASFGSPIPRVGWYVFVCLYSMFAHLLVHVCLQVYVCLLINSSAMAVHLQPSWTVCYPECEDKLFSFVTEFVCFWFTAFKSSLSNLDVLWKLSHSVSNTQHQQQIWQLCHSYIIRAGTVGLLKGTHGCLFPVLMEQLW